MSPKPILYDLYSCAGGGARGYQRAGFEVWGVDIRPQPRYAGDRFIQMDAIAFVKAVMAGTYPMPDAWHASPPCQNWTAYRRKGHGVGDGYPDLIGQTRTMLQSSGRPWVIENVPGAPLDYPFRLCGSSFELDVRRHRMFEINWSTGETAPQCAHGWQMPRFPPATNRTNLRSTVEIGVWRIPLLVQQAAMGIDWMTREELSEAIPPAYTEWVGTRLLRALSDQPAAPARAGDGRRG